MPKCLGAEVSGKRFYTPLEISAAKKLLVSQHNDNIDECSLKAERRIKFSTRTVHEAKLVWSNRNIVYFCDQTGVLGSVGLGAMNVDRTPNYRWLYCVECPPYGNRLEELGSLWTTSCLLPTFHEAWCHVTQQLMVTGFLRLSDVKRYLPCCRPSSDVAENMGRFLVGVYMPEKDWIDSNGRNRN